MAGGNYIKPYRSANNIIGDIMERFNKFIDTVMEFLIISILFLIFLPFRIIYSLSGKSASSR
jgi:large-conductance mechanosensitive channel